MCCGLHASTTVFAPSKTDLFFIHYVGLLADPDRPRFRHQVGGLNLSPFGLVFKHLWGGGITPPVV